MNLEFIAKLITNFSWLWLPIVNVCVVVAVAYFANKTKEKLFTKLTAQKKPTKFTALDVFLYAVSKPITVFIWLMAFTIISHIIEIYLNTPTALEWIEQITKVSIILLLVWIGNRFIHRTENEILEHRWQHVRVDRTSVLAIGKLCRILIYLTGALIVLSTVGIPISGVLALGGVGGIAVGFAAKEMIANFLGGVMLYIERPFSVNDSIELPEKNITGKVSNIGWRTTKIKMLDRRIMYVPNSTFAVTNVINETKRLHCQVHETVRLRYTDMEVLPKIVADLKTMLHNHPDVDSNDTIHVGLTEFGASSLDCLLWCFINKTTKPEYLASLEDILLKTQAIVTANGAEIAYPTTYVLQRNVDE